MQSISSQKKQEPSRSGNQLEIDYQTDVPGDPSGKKKVLVTITSEAFALVIFANCRDKWVADFKLKAGNKRAKIPKFAQQG